MECDLCGKPTTWFRVTRIGGIVEQLTGAKFICDDCVAALQAGIDHGDFKEWLKAYVKGKVQHEDHNPVR